MAGQKVLIITYYWPPAGGPGVQRWLKFAKYLPDFDFEPIVYCPENPTYPIIDNSLLDDIPEEIEVIKQPIKEPYRLARFLSKKSSNKISSGVVPDKNKQSLIERLMLFFRGNLFIPDARKNWIKPSVNFLKYYISDNGIGTIITTGPPHSLHIIGLRLKEHLNINWIADFRDPWTTIGYHKSLKLLQSSQQKHKDLERQVLTQSDKLIVTSYNTKSEFEAKTQTPISVITNGYDTYLSDEINKDTKFSVSHIGSFLSERNPRILWEVLSELVQENEEFSDAFQLNLVGIVSDSVIESIKEFGLEGYLNLVGYVDHNKAVKYQRRSRLLLLIEIDSDDTKAIIPGKIFEYMVSETPILAIGPKDSDIEKIISTTNTGVYFLYSEKEKLKIQLLEYFELFKENKLVTHPIGLQKYSRQSLTEQLALLLKEF